MTSLPPLSDMDAAPADTFPPIPEPVGPDHTSMPGVSTQEPLGEAPKVSQQHRPRAVQDVLKRGAEKLGGNKKRASGIRALTNKDRDKIANFYRVLAGGVTMFRPQAARLMELSADDAADAWMRWAEENDATRKWLLSFLEGSAIMGVVAVNVPILLAFLPDSMWEKLPLAARALHPDILVPLKEMQKNAA